eukprot:ANDGO_08557.mRNA.1 hypothetical protein
MEAKGTRSSELRAQMNAGISQQRHTQLPPPIYAQKTAVSIPTQPRRSPSHSSDSGSGSGSGNSLEALREQEKATWKLNKAASEIGGGIERLQADMQHLSVDVRADRDGIDEFEKQIEFLEKRKKELEKRIRENKEWIAMFEKDIAPFQNRYMSNIAEAEKIAVQARNQSKIAMAGLRDRLKHTT